MSFLTLRTPLFLRSALVAPSRSISSTVRRPAMSEHDTHRDHEERKAEVDKHKDDSLDKQKEGKGEWKHELASSSEAAIKADRGEVKASEEDIKKLQKETEEIMGKK